ncbi:MULTISPECIES: anti-sigma F factor [unclassified Clostridium]|jgi:stage II sporulation protein AB (anti-sigma F factor)|uniref:anti-sigma F factor n=1 Tax=Clostridia TaxID=186801 RepID=UPI0011064D33|nr:MULTISPECIES: anti-sigma F factor [unclassified Clostridium]
MQIKNEMRLDFASLSENEAFARVVVAAFAAQLNPTIEELADLKTAVSEAVTNAIIHGYENGPGTIHLSALLFEDGIKIEIEDDGRGIADVEQARMPFYTSKPELERSGMGFTVMENFMDEVEVHSLPGKGTRIVMLRRFEARDPIVQV